VLTVGVDALLLDLAAPGPRDGRGRGRAAKDLDPAEALALAMAWREELERRPLPGQIEAVPAAATVLLRFATPAYALAARPLLAGRAPAPLETAAAAEHRLEAVYDGEDLADVARLTGLSPEAVVAAHAGTAWAGAFGGFAPGFTYLSGGDPRLLVPRRGTPRALVPAGAVALAGGFSAVYPRASPGGWRLIARTGAVLWDAKRVGSPALIAPGDTVRFVPVRDAARVSAPRDAAPAVPAPADPVPAPADPAPAHGLRVLSPGLLTLVQDLGRPGHAALGVPASGAADRGSARQANRLVGNDEGAPLLETLLGGLRVRAERTLVLSLAGAVGGATIEGPGGARPAPPRAPFALRDGETLTLGPPVSGLRGYLAVRGGLDPAALPGGIVLGSAASDTLSGLGPARVVSGQGLVVGHAGGAAAVGQPEAPATAPPAPGHPLILRAVAGPRDDWFGEAGLTALSRTEWAVGAASDRVGVRLEAAGGAGAPIARIRAGELPSEGVVAGALQVPPSGSPVLFLSDHPVTGGYPVIAVVVPADVDRVAQAAPGTPVRIRLIEAGEDGDAAVFLPDAAGPGSAAPSGGGGTRAGAQARRARTVLVAARGAAAVRVLRACHDEGLRAVAVYGARDRQAPHVRWADDAYLIGGPPPGEGAWTPAGVARLLEIAGRAGADAVHPGWGACALDPAFAAAVLGAGLRWIGAPPSVLAACRSARRFPGRPARVVEVQLFVSVGAAGAARVEVVGTRESWFSRRGTALVAEAPAPGGGPEERLLAGATAAAIEAAESVLHGKGEGGAGWAGPVTVRCGADGVVVEVLPGLTAEHAATEESARVDLVRAQLRAAAGAAGRALSVPASVPRHALALSVAAEEPDLGFLPVGGTLASLAWPTGPGARVDLGVGPGAEVADDGGALATVVLTGEDREVAVRRARQALREMVVTGVPTALPLLRELFDDAHDADGVPGDAARPGGSGAGRLARLLGDPDRFPSTRDEAGAPARRAGPEAVPPPLDPGRELVIDVDGRAVRLGLPRGFFER